MIALDVMTRTQFCILSGVLQCQLSACASQSHDLANKLFAFNRQNLAKTGSCSVF